MSAAGPHGPPAAVHQFVPTLNPRDATGTHTLLLRDILRAAGWRSEIFAEAIHDDLAAEAYKHWTYPEHAAPGDVHIYQFSTSSAVAGFLADRSEPLIVDFHNFTGPEHFAGWEPHTEQRAAPGPSRTGPAGPPGGAWVWPTAASTSGTLRQAGYRRTAVAPVLVDYRRVGAAPDRRVAAELAAAKGRGGADILFVGRIVPSKGQHELVKALWAYRRLYDPDGPAPPGRGHVELRVPQGAAGLRRRAGADRRRCGSPARSPTPHWPPTSPRPTSTSRSRPTRGSACRWSRRWRRGPGGGPAVRRGGRDGRRRGAALGRDRSPLRGRGAPTASAPMRRCAGGWSRRGADACRRSRLDAVGPQLVAAVATGGRGGPMKVAFVTPRYGPEVMGGAETAARQLAEHLVAETGWEAEAYSTCALDPLTWDDVLEPGDTEINGVPVHRFAVGARAGPRLLRPRRPAPPGPAAGHPGRRGDAGSTTTARSRPI